jgi:glutathione S-transferase
MSTSPPRRLPRLELVIADRNYSSWSMRPWVAATQVGIAFETVLLRFTDDIRVAGIEQYYAGRKVPLLRVDGQPVWDSLAICEALAELFPDRGLWPADAAARRMARSVCAEMHSGFQSLRKSMPMNIVGSLPGRGMTPEVQRDVDRIVAVWRGCREASGCHEASGQGSHEASGQGGPLLFGDFTIADAFFAPVAMRFMTYGVALPADAQAYVDALRALPSVQAWMAAARAEYRYIAAEEPYGSAA